MSYDSIDGNTIFRGLQKGFHLRVEENNLKSVKNKKSCRNSKNRIKEIQEETAAISFAIQQLSNGTRFQTNSPTLSTYTALSRKQRSINSMITGFRGLFRSKSTKKELHALNIELKKLKQLFEQNALTSATAEKVLSFQFSSERNLEQSLRKELTTVFKNKPRVKDFANSPFFISKNRVGYTVHCSPLNPTLPPEMIPIRSLTELPAALQRYNARKIKNDFSAYFSRQRLDMCSDSGCRMAVGRIELFYQEEADLGKNQLIVKYYDPAKGEEELNVNLNDINPDQLRKLIQECQEKSRNSLARIDEKAKILENKLKPFGLSVKYDIYLKNFKIYSADDSPYMTIKNFENDQLTSDEWFLINDFLLKRIGIKNLFPKKEFTERIHSGFWLQNREGFGFKVSLHDEQVEIFVYDIEKESVTSKKFELNENLIDEIQTFCRNQTQMREDYLDSLAKRAKNLEEKLKLFDIKVEYSTISKYFSVKCEKPKFSTLIPFRDDEIKKLKENVLFKKFLLEACKDKIKLNLRIESDYFVYEKDGINNIYKLDFDFVEQTLAISYYGLATSESVNFDLNENVFDKVTPFIIENFKTYQDKRKAEQAKQKAEQEVRAAEKSKKTWENIFALGNDSNSKLALKETKTLEEFGKRIEKLTVHAFNVKEVSETLSKIIPVDTSPRDILDTIFETPNKTDIPYLVLAYRAIYPTFELSPYDLIRIQVIADRELTNDSLLNFLKEHELDKDEQKVLACYDLAYLANNPRIYPLSAKPISADDYTLNFLWVNLNPQDRVQDSAHNIFEDGLNLLENAECIKDPKVMRRLEEEKKLGEGTKSENWKNLKKTFTYRISKWADVHPNAQINLWYDSALVTQNAQQKTFEMMREISKSRGVNLKLRDIRQLHNLTGEIENAFHPGTPVHYRAGLLKALIADHMMSCEDETAKYCVVSDIDVKPMPAQQIFDQRTVDYLSSNGYVFNREGLGCEHIFSIFDKNKENLQKIHYHTVIEQTASDLSEARQFKKNANLSRNHPEYIFGSLTISDKINLFRKEMKEPRKDAMAPRKVVSCPSSQFDSRFSEKDHQSESFRFIGSSNIPFTKYGRNYERKRGKEGQIESLLNWKAEPLVPNSGT